MKKDKKAELNKKDELKGVASASKPVSKKPKKESKKKANEVVAKETVAAIDQIAKIVDAKNDAAGENGLNEKKKNKKQKKDKKVAEVETTKVQPAPKPDVNAGKVLSEEELARIEKKKKKKLAQKLKKQQNKAKGPGAAKKTNGKVDATAAEGAEKVPKIIAKKKLKAEKKQQRKEEEKKAERGPIDPAETAATVFVGNLPINTKRVQLMRLFKDYGPVNSVRFRTAGGKPIFKHKHRLEAGALNAYLVLSDAATAQKARALNGTEFKGNHLRVTGADMNSHNRGNDETKRTIFVGNLKYSATEEKLREIFTSCGEIDYIRCLRAGESGCKGVAYVCFKTPEAVGLAMELNETVLDERPIHVERYTLKKQGAKQTRDAKAAVEQKAKTGAKKRLDDKKQKKAGKKPKEAATEDGGNKKKKGEFRGVKVDDIIKKHKKKKLPSKMQQLAKKIAPKKLTSS